eukprot:Phypoly_transcript_08708.p1 GENE.Phypoly_transcript_08708~~Phypoly_transcript_08708.p1  ORF type:complete len:482 (+),score=78.49 Phypoly_transcript_08708:80-1447(+)
MEQEIDYKNAVAILKELQQQQSILNDNSSSKAQKKTQEKSHSEIDAHFEKCIKALNARRDQLHKVVDDFFKDQKKTVEDQQQKVKVEIEGCKKLVETGTSLYAQNPSAAVASWKAAKSIKFAVSTVDQFKVQLPETLIKSIQSHGSVEMSVPTAVKTEAEAVTTLAGLERGFADGAGTSAKLNQPHGVVLCSADSCLYVCDVKNNAVRRVSPSGEVSKFAEVFGPAGIDFHEKENCFFVSCHLDHSIKRITFSGAVSNFVGGKKKGNKDGSGTSARFNSPEGIAIDQLTGNIYISDYINNVIRLVNLQGKVSTLAGSGKPGHADGEKKTAKFDGPFGISFHYPTQSLIVCDFNNNKVKKVSLEGKVSTICEVARPCGVTISSNGFLVSSSVHNKIYNIKDNTAEHFAGSGEAGSVDGTLLKSSFNEPSGLAYDTKTNTCYVTERESNRIRKIAIV